MNSREVASHLTKIHQDGLDGRLEFAFRQLNEFEQKAPELGFTVKELRETSKRIIEMRVYLLGIANDDPEAMTSTLIDLIEFSLDGNTRDLETVLIGLKSLLKSL